MQAYILRRVLAMIPTVLGVIIITFVLFNVAGGDPAVMKLGKQANPKLLEEYDIQRGYDKPLLFGLWGRTRSYTHSDFSKGAGPWSGVEGATLQMSPTPCLVLSNETCCAIPLALNPQSGRVYRWVIQYSGGPASLEIRADGMKITGAVLEETRRWRTSRVVWAAPATATNIECSLSVGKSPLRIRSLLLQRRARHALDSQFVFYLRQVLRCDFGVSTETNQRVSQMILSGILPSLALTVPMFVIGVFLEIILALLCAFFRDTFIDRLFVIFSVALMSVNYLVWIVLGQYVLGYQVRLFPVWGFESWRYLILPCIIGVASGLGAGIRFYRAIMLDEMYRDYVRTAKAKGVSRSGVLFKHVLKNAMIPILTSVIMAIPFLYTGSLLLESFFGIPGLGNLAINAINNSDVDVVRAVVLVGAFLYVIANLVTDIAYTLVDPRIRLS